MVPFADLRDRWSHSMTEAHAFGLAVSFLREQGIECHSVHGTGGFVPGVRIVSGALHYDPDVACTANLLHEAGHVAILPSIYRAQANDDISKVARKMLAEVFEAPDVDPDSPQACAAMQCSDPEATAWAYSAGRHLGIPDELVIRDTDYQSEGDQIRLALKAGAYAGINGLARAGFCVVTRTAAAVTGRPRYPTLSRWLQI
jgi:dienelactone hydrolase